MSSRATSASSMGSPVSSETADDGLISVQYFGNPSASESNGPGSGYPKYVMDHISPVISCILSTCTLCFGHIRC